MSKGVDIICNDQAEGVAQLTISGNLTLRNATTVKQALIEAQDKYKHLSVLLSEVNSLDVSVIQIIMAAKSSNPAIQWNITLSDDIQTLLVRAGLAL
ncbi:STAS domain-containing protein [Xanthocytophaga agilis]|uniref:STAS domain-containing protein n=1 Tax=Xanthocytophaga agilis TaxID=3048010 RepID=A0AAE3R0E2_9BACT|nr:STAS domain-containing protein [Xanthocytophaga agilis]MDJ1501419.1 STAS domain-containing protein [Xanthocytophaga agilis]